MFLFYSARVKIPMRVLKSGLAPSLAAAGVLIGREVPSAAVQIEITAEKIRKL
jgi:hypothetical protein